MRSEREILQQARTIAVVGCSDQPGRDSGHIARYLKRQGYKVYCVNPTIESFDGERCWPDVKSLPEKVDIVDVFRHPRFVPGVVEDAIEAGSRAVWLQLGVTHPEAEERARKAGLDVVSDECIAVEHRALGIGRIPPAE